MDFVIIFDVIITGLGMYLIFASFQMRRTGQISTVIINKEEIARCRDKKGFTQSIFGQTLAIGLFSLIYGGLGIVNDTLYALGGIFDFGGVVVFLVLWFWYTRELKKKKELFFY